MLDSFLVDNGGFTNYGVEHGVCFVTCIFIICLVLYLAKYHWNDGQRRLYITLICSFGALTQLFKVFYKYQTGIFDPANDLPLHLCNILTLVMPFIMWYKHKTIWAMTFFWIMAGCAQSIFTPTLTESMPHYEALRYWAVHTVIILGALYGCYVYKYTISLMDALRSFIGINILAAILYPINMAFNANYMYLNAKPAGKTFYDLLGKWPDYILVLEIIIVVIFSLMLIPFNWKKIKSLSFIKNYK
ncbi:MAG: TIGR02206 family membrane protein [Saprospiraceae bacterium]|nr:TIGR02206 family membrane protein [Saprospiraceae bacterium]